VVFFISRNYPGLLPRPPDENARRETGHSFLSAWTEVAR
jgi:hypothetical protein